MSRSEYNDDLIRGYLLGVLPDAEAESFEQRYLENHSLFAELQEVEDELIDDYAGNALNDEQRRTFEKYFLSSPERQEKLDLARAITARAIEWRQEREAKQQTTTVIGPAAKADGDKLLQFRRSPQTFPGWFQWMAIAASVLFAVGVGWLWLRNRDLQHELTAQRVDQEQWKQKVDVLAKERDNAVTEATTAKNEATQQKQENEDLLARFRDQLNKYPFEIDFGTAYRMIGSKGEGERKIKSVVIPAGTNRLRFSVDFPKTDFSTFQATLRHADQSPIGSTHHGLKARITGEKQTITFTELAKSLPTGDYELTVSVVTPDGSTEGLGRYYLHVVRR